MESVCTYDEIRLLRDSIFYIKDIKNNAPQDAHSRARNVLLKATALGA